MGVILIAFERESEQGSIEQLLSARGHRVVKSANGLSALDAARRDPPDAIVSDIVLPRMDGFALCRKWKQDERLQSVPFVFYTRRHDDPKYERFALELGAERFLAKSVPPEALLTAIDELVVNNKAAHATPTMKLPTLDETVIQRAVVKEKAQKAAQAEAQERALKAQAERAQAEKAQAQAVEQAQKAQAQALEQAQKAQAQALEQSQKVQSLEQAQKAQADALDKAQKLHAEALEKVQKALAAATEQAQHDQSRLRSQLDELEATNQRLSAGEARFRRIFESNPLPMWIADHATGGFIAVNEAALNLHGYTRAEFLALKGSALAINGDDDADLRVHRRKDGGRIVLSLSSQEIEFDGRRADLVSGFDLTEHASEQQQLQDQASTGRAMLEAAADGAWVLDGDGRLLNVNAAYSRMSGYSREDLLKMRASDIEDQTSGETTMRLQMGRVTGGGRYETKHRRRDGTSMDVEVSVGMIESTSGHSVVLIRDVSQRRRDQVAQRVGQRQTEFLVDLFKQADSVDESTVVRRLVDHALDSTQSPLAYLYFVDPANKTMTLAAWRDKSQPQATIVDVAPRPVSRAGLFTECVRARHATSSNDLSWKAQQDGLPDLQRYLAVPMVSDEETVAVLGVANREAVYGEEDQKLLATLADGAWRVLKSKRSHAHTLRSLQRTDVALQGMIDSLVRMTERHDPYTAGSSRRLAALAVAIGREAGLDGQRQHALRVAALLHDIGNVAVPASILSKPAPLTETELALMRTHVEEGCQLLAEIDFGAPIADIVYQTHERVDGSGYPRGLKGDDILLEARILAIADTVEAMCSPRPYRPAAGMEAAIDEINKGAGRLYDLHLVAACTRLVRQHGFMLPE